MYTGPVRPSIQHGSVAGLLALSLGNFACGSSSAQPSDGRAPDADAADGDVGTAADVRPDAGDVGTATDARDATGVDVSSPWQNLTPNPLPTTWPSARSQMAIAVDTSRQKVMVFGGVDGSATVLDDLWEWDITSGGWTNRTVAPRPAAWPPARFHHAMTFDEKRVKLVVFGGAGIGGNLGDTWEWDPGLGTWGSGGMTLHPFNRFGPTLAYDQTGIVVLFGGSGDGGISAELWEWYGSTGTWTNGTPAQLPPAWPTPRTFHGAAYDGGRMKMMVFGGEGLATMPDRFDDLWEWDRSTRTWTSRTPTPRPQTWPGGRSYPGVAFATKAGKLVLYSGLSGPGIGATSELWSFDGSFGAWTNLTPASLPSTWPLRRVGHAVAYDANADSVFVFAGQGLSGLMAELWRFDAARL
jgi:Galactose oxidase, central domain